MTDDQPGAATPAEVAAAFSSHRFDEALPRLAPDVRWVAVGQGLTAGRDAVAAVCAGAAEEMAGVRTEFTRFVVAAGEEVVAVDTVARYAGDDGTTSVVSSCDIYEFAGGEVHTITSYAVELEDGGPA